jgi:hypothetical protein
MAKTNKIPSENLKESQKDLKAIEDTLDSIGKKIYKAFEVDPKDSLKSFKNTLDSVNNIAEQLQSHQENIAMYGQRSNGLSSDQLKNLSSQLKYQQKKLIGEKENLKLNNERLKTELAIARVQGKSVDVQKDLEKQIRSNNKAQEHLENSIQGAVDAQKQLNKETAKTKFAEMGQSLDKIQTPLDGMLNPLNLINKLMGFIFGTAIETDAQLGNAAKSMNMTYSAAAKSRGEMVKLANASGDLLLNSKNIEETTLAINESLGSNVAFEKMSASFQKDVGFLSKMSHYAGLTAEEANNIAKLTLATGQSAEKFTGELMGQVKASGLQKGIILNEKTALKEISNTSAAIKMSFHGSAKGLADAYAKSKALGTSLEKVDDIAGSILNFEESIEAELSAELLTGKDLNLEKAREAALNNDIGTVAEEIAKNVGSAADFAKMNRIQQDAIAKSVGMTREELASSLQEQESLKAIGAASLEDARAEYDTLVEKYGYQEAAKMLGDEQLAQQFQQQSIQEKLGAAQLKMADETMPAMLSGLDKINANFEKMFNKVKEIFDMFGGMKLVLGVIGALLIGKLVKGIIDFGRGVGSAISFVQKLFAAEKATAGVEVVSGSYKMASGLGPLGIAAVGGLIGAGLTALAAYTMSDGIIGPSGGNGFGDRVLFGPEGAISFNNKDTIVAGTNLFKANDMISAPAGGINIGEGNKDMNELKGAIMALATRPVDVAIDGTKVIEATTGARPNTQGVESAKNSYRIQ